VLGMWLVREEGLKGKIDAETATIKKNIKADQMVDGEQKRGGWTEESG